MTVNFGEGAGFHDKINNNNDQDWLKKLEMHALSSTVGPHKKIRATETNIFSLNHGP